MDVPASAEQVLVGLDSAGMEPASEERTIATEAVVDMAGVDGPDALHRFRESTVGTMDEKVIVVVHEAVRIDQHSEAFMGIEQALPELDAISVVEVHGAVVDAAIHHVVEAVFDVWAELSGHHTIMTKGCHISVGV